MTVTLKPQVVWLSSENDSEDDTQDFDDTEEDMDDMPDLDYVHDLAVECIDELAAHLKKDVDLALSKLLSLQECLISKLSCLDKN